MPITVLLGLVLGELRQGGRSLWVFAACLALGVALVSAAGGLFRQVDGALQSEARELFGGDVEVEASAALPDPVLDWMAQRGAVSRVVELRSMLRAPDGRAQLVELQSADARYPLVGQMTLEPALSLADALRVDAQGRHGVVVDPALARRLSLQTGSQVQVGTATLVVRAVLVRQPDRSLRATWSGAPVLLSDAALEASGLVQPLSRVEYRYRTVTDQPPDDWVRAFVTAHPEVQAELRTFEQRSARMAEVLGQIGSGLLMIGFAALFIGGLGVFNSVGTFLQGQLLSMATLRALGLRDRWVAAVVLTQVLMLAAVSSAAGAVAGALLASSSALAAQADPSVPRLALSWTPLVSAALVAWCFGVLTALTFALPAVGRALSVSPAVLFRGVHGLSQQVPARVVRATVAVGCAGAALLAFSLPDTPLAVAFVLACALIWLLLEGVTRGLRALAGMALARGTGRLPVAMQLALVGLQREGSPLRAALLSLGTALTLLVACTLVVASLLRTVNEVVPQRAPALVFYDVQPEQRAILEQSVRDAAGGSGRVQLAPLVLGRLVAVNGQPVDDTRSTERALAAREEHKFSHRDGNIDDVVIAEGAWWPADYRGEPLVAFEDREAEPLGLQVGDRLQFDILGVPVEARLAALYSQRRLQSRLWLEGIFSDGVLDPFITRYVGAAYLPAPQAGPVQDVLAERAPNVVTVQTETLLAETRRLLGAAAAGLALVAGVCLVSSLLVLASVVAASRARQVYESTVMHVLGARRVLLGRVIAWEYGLLASVTAGFATVVGTVLSWALLTWRIGLSADGLWPIGLSVAIGVSTLSLGLGAQHLLRRLRVQPALLLRSGG